MFSTPAASFFIPTRISFLITKCNRNSEDGGSGVEESTLQVSQGPSETAGRVVCTGRGDSWAVQGGSPGRDPEVGAGRAAIWVTSSVEHTH